MMRQTFDLLSHAIPDGEPVEPYANLEWINPRNFTITMDPDIAPFFHIDSWGLITPYEGCDTRRFVVAARRIETAEGGLRFAATVECDVDEGDEG